MRITRKTLTTPLCTSVLVILLAASATSAVTFTFTNLTDAPLGPGSGTSPSINNAGDVAFTSGSSLFFYDRGTDTFLDVTALPGAPASPRTPRLNSAGDILWINSSTRDLWLFEAASQAFTNISLLPNFPGNTQANDLGITHDLNDFNQVSFHSGDNNFGEIYLYEHATGAFTKVTDQIGGPSSGRGNKINDVGQVIYGAVGLVTADVYAYDIVGGTTTNITDLPGGPGTGLGSIAASSNGDIAVMLQAGNDPVIYTASTTSFLSLAPIPSFPIGNGSVSQNSLSSTGDFTFYRTAIHHFDAETQTFTQLTNQGPVPAGGRMSSINDNGRVAFTAGLASIEDIFIAAPPCPGDANGDGLVNLADLQVLLFNFGTIGPAGDVDGDGDVDLDDLSILLFNFGRVC